MRVLVVARWSPWPTHSGSRLRSANVIDALSRLGETDVFLLARSEGDMRLRPPAELRLGRTDAVVRPIARPGRWGRVRWILGGRLPLEVYGLDYTDLRRRFREWSGEYDLAWFVRPESYLALGDLVDCPAIVDLDDLHERTQLPRLASWPAGPNDPDASDSLRARYRRHLRERNTRVWAQLERQIARRVDAVAVCSDGDAARLDVPNAVVVPNGFDSPIDPVGRGEVHDPPVLCLHGSLTYGPNTDAAARLAIDVAPLVRAELPGAVVRIVGEAGPDVERLDNPPRVVVTGRVPDIVTELRRADVVAVPLRYGSGTKIKILEALAHRIPVVTTSIGAEGLDVEHGRHLLIADDPGRFADACVRLLRDEELRRSLAAEGRRLVEERYRWSSIRDALREVVTRVTEGVPAPAR